MAWTVEQKSKMAERMKETWAKRKAAAGSQSPAKSVSVIAATGIQPSPARGKKTGGAFTCARCGRSFGMAMHLARHVSSAHTRGKAKPMQRKPRMVVTRKAAPPRSSTGVTSASAPILADMAIDSLITMRRDIDRVLVERLIQGAT